MAAAPPLARGAAQPLILLEAVVASVGGPRLTPTDIGRRFAGSARRRPTIQRADRLLGNPRLQGEARSVYAALCPVKVDRIQRTDTLPLKGKGQGFSLVHLLEGQESLTLFQV